jgi:hypothetical protein
MNRARSLVALAVVALGSAIAASVAWTTLRADGEPWPGLARASAQRQALFALQQYHADTGIVPSRDAWVDAIEPYFGDMLVACPWRPASTLIACGTRWSFDPRMFTRFIDPGAFDAPGPALADTVVLHERELFRGEYLLHHDHRRCVAHAAWTTRHARRSRS